MAFTDIHTYLPDDILAKVDRASMANSLEVRVPLLDHRLVEFMAHLPLSMKLKNGTPKHMLRQVLYRYVPKELVERPKMGFAVPIDRWLRGPLRDWAEDLLDEKKLHEGGWFDPAPIRKAWRRHLRGAGIHQEGLWGVLTAQAWLDRWT
jgi:asparagine synthase (glutamine-hydrolysing)